MLIKPSPLVWEIIGAGIAVHRSLGPGLFESAYEPCFVHELAKRGLTFARQVPVPLVYDGIVFDCVYRADVLVNGEILVELKCIEKFLPIHTAQMVTYLRLLRLRQGLLMNFNVTRLVDGVRNVLVDPESGLPSEAKLIMPV